MVDNILISVVAGCLYNFGLRLASCREGQFYFN